MTGNEKTIVLLIDADNAQTKRIKSIIMELSAFGRIVVKRAYGNWTKDTLKKWEDHFRELAIKPIHQIDYVKEKNATDMALTIDAMDFLYNSDYDIYAIVSSDSDFTPLAIKLREAGKIVIGVGNEKTPVAFIQSCDDFFFVENIQAIHNKQSSDSTKMDVIDNQNDDINELDELLKIASDKYQDADGFTNISSAGVYIKRVNPSFDINAYSVKKLPEYIAQKSALYEMKKYKGKGGVNIIAYRIK